MKAYIGLKLWACNRNCEKHGKDTVDCIGHLTCSLITACNVAALETLDQKERCSDAESALETLRAGGIYCDGALEGGLLGLNSSTPSEVNRIKATGQHFDILPLELVELAIAEARPCEVKTRSHTAPGQGRARLRGMRFSTTLGSIASLVRALYRARATRASIQLLAMSLGVRTPSGWAHGRTGGSFH
jgi:hypothetical protein